MYVSVREDFYRPDALIILTILTNLCLWDGGARPDIDGDRCDALLPRHGLWYYDKLFLSPAPFWVWSILKEWVYKLCAWTVKNSHRLQLFNMESDFVI